jgi:hypothetical protein
MATNALEAAGGQKKISAVIGKRPGKDATEIQSYIFAPKSAWTPDEVKAWLKKHKKASALDATGDSYRARQSEPSEFKRNSFRTITIKGREDDRFDADESVELDDTATLDTLVARLADEGYDEELIEASDDKDYATVGGKRVHRSDFAYAPPGSGPSEWKLPIDTESRTRNALARYNQADLPSGAKQAVKRKILRKAKQYKIDTSGFEKKYMREPLEFSEVRDGKIKIMIAYTTPTGKTFSKDGREFTISADDLEQTLRNLKKDGQVPTDYGHWSAKEDAPPGNDIKSGKILAEGAEIKPFKDGRQALWAFWEPTPRALAFVKAKEYTHFSPELEFDSTDETGEKRGTRLKAGALTNRPFLRELPEIEVSDTDYNASLGFPPQPAGALVSLRLTESRDSLILEEDMSKKTKLVRAQESAADVMKKLELRRMEGEDGEALKKFRVHGEDGEALGELEADDMLDALEDAGLDAEALKRLDAEGLKRLDAEDVLDEVMRRLEGEGDAGDGVFAKKLKECLGKFPPWKRAGGDGEPDDGEPDDDKELPPKLSAKLDARGVKLADVRRFIDAGRKADDAARIAATNTLLLKESVTNQGALRTPDAFEARMTELAGQNKLSMADYMRITQARRRIENGISQGKILPREAAFYLREALERPQEFAAWLSATLPRIDLESVGVVPGADGFVLTATEELKTKAHKLIEDSKKNGRVLNLGEAMISVRAAEPELAKRVDVEQKAAGVGAAKHPVTFVQ